MCLYPKLIKNKRYSSTKKNGGIIPPINDIRTTYIAAGCGNCIECRKKKARDWQVRLLEDIKTNKNAKFVTLTFSDQAIAKLTEEVNTTILHLGKMIKTKRNLTGYVLDNEIAIRAMRRFNERWRKKYKKAIRHWMITELGHNGTNNIHLHGIIWVEMEKEKTYEEVEKIWQYGTIWPRSIKQRKTTYVNERTIGYMTKYVSKVDKKYTTYKPKILTSAGIGANYKNTWNARRNKYKGEKTNEAYITSTGHEIGLPIYWRNAIYNEEEREKLWINKLNEEVRWVGGRKIDISKTLDEYNETVKYERIRSKKLGYGTDEKSYDKQEYEREQRIIMQQTRIAKGKKKIKFQD